MRYDPAGGCPLLTGHLAPGSTPAPEVITARPLFSWPSGALVVLALLGLGCEGELPSVQPGHEGDLRVVLIVIDTMRADRLPPWSPRVDSAPFLEDLASRSVVFRHAHSTSSWTAPAVASLFTSLQPIQHGVQTGLFLSRRLGLEVNRLPDDVTLLPELFQNAGYATLGVSDNVNISSKLGFERGFHRFREMNYEGGDRVSAIALEWLDELRDRGRTFLYLHYLDPHRPYHERAPWFEEFESHESGAEARYDSEIRYVDEQIAQLFQRFGWDENTLVVILSDHGEEFGDHGGDNHGHTLYSELVDIPLLLYCPRLWPAGEVVDAHVSIVDVLPTLAEICGLEVPEGAQGFSLVDVIEGGPRTPSPIYSHLHRRDLGSTPEGLVLRSAIFGQRKLIVSNDGPRQLFDLSTDPGEQRDRAGEWEIVTAAFEEMLRRYETQLTPHGGALDAVPVDEELRQKLRALGYAEASDGR